MRKSRPCLKFFALPWCIVLSLWTSPGWAESEEGPTIDGARKAFSKNQSPWTSAAHLGWGVESSSSTGFTGAAGSMVMFDVVRDLLPTVALGFRSSGSGAVQDTRRLSRLGVGPVLEWRVMSRLHIQTSLVRFHESVTQEETNAWTSSGVGLTVGWTRIVPIMPGVDLSWGGFLGRHWGKVAPEDSFGKSAGASGTRAPTAVVRSNIGATRGIEIALRTQL